jgi:hypothetical protein
MKSSVTPFKSSLRSGACDVLLYDGIFGMVGDRACAPRMPKAFSASVLLCRWRLMPLADRSCRATDGAVGTVGMAVGPRFATKRELPRDVGENWRGAVAVRGVLPCGLLCGC